MGQLGFVFHTKTNFAHAFMENRVLPLTEPIYKTWVRANMAEYRSNLLHAGLSKDY